MDEYLDFATQLARKAGDIMLEYFQIGVPTKLKAAEGNTPVTIADTTINTVVVDSVKAKYPTHAVLGEEQSLPVDGAPYTWVCDPIDGTMPYSAGVPTNVFSLGLVDAVDGQPVVAVVYDPYMKRLYHAVKGGGAYLNDERITVSRISTLADATIGTSSKRSKVVDSNALKFDIMTISFRQLAFNSAVYEAMMVAAGQLAAQVFVGSGAHDVVAARLIVEEAGGKATDIFGHEQRYDKAVSGAMISNDLVHDELVRLAIKNKLR
jgi:fructose-1,6-bisphosphatase/inositol monophosphatase family enzyme